jgi:DNA modification methylase/superfamily II DNA or RNA helicase
MARGKKKPAIVNTDGMRDIEAYTHDDKKRANNPSAGMAQYDTAPETRKTYAFDPHLDPTLDWAGKKEGLSFDVPTSSIHIHESIKPHKIIRSVQAIGDDYEDAQLSFFETPVERMRRRRDAIEFYQHGVDWTNRLIAGDSLVVMNSLLEKEGMSGQVQMVYIDPPYGIKYGSNFQPFVNNHDVKDKDDDLTQEPEMVTAFRDTWELGIHSYLSYLRNRLLLARELLSDSGSVFVQISDENVHLVRNLCDEVFGVENFVAQIVFRKTGSQATNKMGTITDYIVFYAKNKKQLKFKKLYYRKASAVDAQYNRLLLADGTNRTLSPEEKENLSLIPTGAKLFQATSLQSDGRSENTDYSFVFKGKTYEPNAKSHWKTSIDGLERLAENRRIIESGNSLRYLRFFDDFSYNEFSNLWEDTYGASNMQYVVETSPYVIARCLLMTTDPGDLVLDITCGSGTTAYVAEQWGRRWITCDTSRVALTLAKKRLMTATFDYYKLAHEEQGVAGGFVYKTVPHITLKSIANNEPSATETLYDQPEVDKTKIRVSGPFTVEALPAPVGAVNALPLDEAAVIDEDYSAKQSDWREELLATGILGRGGNKIEFSRVEPLSGTVYLQAEAETKEDTPRRAVICFAGETMPLDVRMVEMALDEVDQMTPIPALVIFAAFQFDPVAARMIDDKILYGSWKNTVLLKAQMNTDLMTDDLKKKRSSNQSFWLVGQPDVELVKIGKGKGKGKYQVHVNGFDYYDVKAGKVVSGNANRIAMWSLDTNYDGMALEPVQVFFPMGGGWDKLAKTLKAEINQDLIEAYGYNDIGQFIELPLVNDIRGRVKSWRGAGYPGVTGVTKKLLEHWNDKETRQYQFFWCQQDAMETLIWLVEASPAERVGINLPNDGGAFQRICTKLCTGGGKTTVMAMLIAWQICNKVTYPQDKRFSKNIFIVAPGLTVKSRLQVLNIGGDDNYCTQFSIVPVGLMEKLRQGKVIINNWQTLAWESEEKIGKKRGVDKRGAKSDEAYTREVLGEMANAHNLIVINDEAHHAWRRNPEIKVSGKEAKEAAEEATVWISCLDRINKTCGILTCYDFSATPFAPSGKKNDEEALFGWIVSDFGLNDGIESGLVKTPRVVVRDDVVPDTETFKSKLYHIYTDDTVKDDINRSAQPEEPLPTLLTNAYWLLGADWLEAFKTWKKDDPDAVPPVMITVANRTETAARIKHMFDHTKRVPIDELCEPDYILQMDSTTIDNDAALREKVDTVGRNAMPGEQIRNVISVAMLSEGRDAKTVTHILGLRAFSSQLLCEQVVGRGLRRTSYDLDEDSDMFTAEYVNIFGIPFSFLPHESDETGAPKPPNPKTQIEPLKEKAPYAISFPNIIRIDRVFKPVLSLDLNRMETLTLEADKCRLRADLAPIVDGQTDLTKCTDIDLEKLQKELRMQRIIFEAAGEVYSVMNASWQKEGTKFALIGQVIEIVRQYLDSGAIHINPPLLNLDPLRRRLILMLSMGEIVRHLWDFIQVEQTDSLVPIFDSGKKVRSTGDMNTWYTSKPCKITERCHISHCVFDSAWEDTESYKIQNNSNVSAWVKNDHLGFEVVYVYEGVVRKYYPDFLIRLTSGKMLILETKGQKSKRTEAKRKALEEWIESVNGTGNYGIWCGDVSYNVADVDGIIARAIAPDIAVI